MRVNHSVRAALTDEGTSLILATLTNESTYRSQFGSTNKRDTYLTQSGSTDR